MEDYIELLNQQQQAAVLYDGGPQLVIAGAGSGKTRVLTYKIVHLLEHGYEPWRIMALTFTNKAAREMRSRIEAIVGPTTAGKLWMGTFHSIFARILRLNADRIGYKSNFTIYDTADSKSLVKTIIKDMELDDKIYKPSTVLSAISAAKNALISPDSYANAKDIRQADRRSHRDRMAEVYRAYCTRCFVAGAMDFDDLLYYTNVLLRDNPDILRHYREYFRYVLVDEYQDTNFSQHLIVSQLTQESGQLCVVGDDAQSIYSFRGANIRNILNLQNAYPSLKIFKLEQNYRSTQNIINAANTLIDKNTEQIRKQVFSRNEIGSRIEVVKSYSDYEESFLVANRIALLRTQQHDSFEEYAILYRTNAQSRILEESLRKRNIPYRIYGGLSFYQRKEVKDAIAYFRLTLNPNDDEALIRIINYPSRGIGETTIKKVYSMAKDTQVSMWDVLTNLDTMNPGLNAGTKRKIDAFVALIEKFNSTNASGADALTVAREIIADTGLLSVLLSDRTPESISKQENIEELINGVKEFVTARQEEGAESCTLSDFLAEVSLATDQDTNLGEDMQAEERVTLMTVHAAKGLEFSNVFIVGVEEELFPSAMSCDTAAGVEEERRLLYVAITRAKRFCMMSYASSRFRNGQTVTCSPSRFLRDIDDRYLDFVGGSQLTATMHNPMERYRSSFHSPASPVYSSPVRTAPLRQTSPSPRFQPARTASAPASGGGDLHQASELAENMRIEHSRFGYGTVKSVDRSQADVRITVDFDNTGTKTLLLKFARFNIIDK